MDRDQTGAHDRIDYESGLMPLLKLEQPSTFAQIRLINSSELASALGFDGVTSAFRRFCNSAGIEPVPGRKNFYDPVAVRNRLDRLQGLGSDLHSAADRALQKSRMRRCA